MSRRTLIALVALSAALSSVLSGCADIPTTGDPETVKAQGAPAQSVPQVRVIAQGPRPADSQISIVSGFLEASGTTEEGFATARKFLTPDGSARWAAREITIYDQDEFSLVERTGDRVVLATRAVGRVDYQGVYLAESSKRAVQVSFQLARMGVDWRIASPPPGLLVSQQDFEREYRQIDNYFIARPPRTSVLVPDPVYTARTQVSPTARVESLLRGPSRWLSAVAMTAAPSGAELAEPVTILSGVALVRLTPESVPIEGVARDLMLAQIVMTLTQDPEINQVEIRAAGQPALSFGDAGNTTLRRQDVVPYLPADLRPPPPPAYFVRDGAAFTVGLGVSPGPLPAETELAEIAVAPGGVGLLAGISEDRTTLWTARADQPKELTVRARGVNLRSLSFDGDGDLWVVEGVARSTVVRRYPPTGEALRVASSGFEARQISRLRVAADGVRVAMVLDTIEGAQVYIAQASESASGLRIAAPRRMAAALSDPRSVDWADPGHLVVLAAPPNAQVQPFEVSLSGPIEPFAGTPPPGMTEVSVTFGQPAIAATKKNEIYRLREDGTWFKEGPGTAPTYPG
ncbi:LpqB family beta-propeller domain-containing protein [Sporichthya sp.]|uniref:LpqB family beta-propeller domain-containing protein n=1 Tax=Sporichthya sp. TaxID=65475 RepID=UPI00185862C4|nr:LpqB family beta-propeller domain-containing protein [Sporichthya sp.]MBA3745463.1 GerMN domain-containing protein [Sporichthya sp.]